MAMSPIIQCRQRPFFREKRQHADKQTGVRGTEKHRHATAYWCILSQWAVKTFPELSFSNFQYAAALSLRLQCRMLGLGFHNRCQHNGMHFRQAPSAHTAVLPDRQHKQSLKSYWSPTSPCHAENIEIWKADNTYSKVSPGIWSRSRWAFMVVVCEHTLL